MVLNWFLGDSSDGNKNLTSEESQAILAKFHELSSQILTIPEPIEVLTLDAVQNYFESDRPASQNVSTSKCALIRQPHDEGQLLALVFLDRNSQLILRFDGTPYGRQLVARSLDQKLEVAFEDKELIMVEQKRRKDTKDRIDEFLSQYEKQLRKFLGLPEVISIVTYESVIQYFVKDRPKDPRVQKGAILREPHPQGYHLTQMFLDAQNQPVLGRDGKPYGRQLVAKELDEELEKTFDDKDLIIVE